MSKAGESQGELVNPQGSSLSLADPRWLAVERVLDSNTFRRSPRLKEFLRFVAERTIAGQTEQLTESAIGHLVFHRGDDYIPTDDSIVRSSARQLRAKLREYFDTEGLRDRWTIVIPKGGYAVHFEEREPGPLPSYTPPPEVRLSTGWRAGHLAIALGIALLLSSLALNAWLLHKTASGTSSRAKLSLLGSLVMNNSHATQFIMDDYAFVLMHSAANHHLTLEDYAGRAYLGEEFIPTHDPAFLRLWKLLSTRYVVSLGAAAAAEDALRAVPQQQKLLIRHARNIVPREFKQGSFILFGSPPNNPWAELFEDKLNFQKSPSGFINRHPLAGEQAAYNPQRSLNINSGTGYARLAFLPNSSGDGFILLLTGVNMVTSEAAAEYASDPTRVTELLKITGAASVEKITHFEVLLQTSAVDTTPKDVRVIAHRRLD